MKPAAVAAATLSMSTAPLYAGGAAEPRVDPEVMAPDVVATQAAASSTGGFVLPLILLAIIAATVAGSDTPRE